MNIKKRKITNFINEDYKQYAIYTISSRGIPNVLDSLTPVQRMIVLHAPKTSQKTLSLVGEIFKTGRYHHGDSSLAGAIQKLAKTYQSSEPTLIGDGFFGNSINSEAAAARYTSIKINPIIDNIIKKYLHLNIINEESDSYEPIHLDLPIGLLSLTLGISVGYQTKILPRKLTEIEKYLNGKKADLNPNFKNYNGKVSNFNNKKTVWLFEGVFDVDEKNKCITIKEIPPILKYNTVLTKLNRLLEPIFDKISFINNSTENINITIKLNNYFDEYLEQVKRTCQIIFTEQITFVFGQKIVQYNDISEYLNNYKEYKNIINEKDLKYNINKNVLETVYLKTKLKFLEFMIEKTRTEEEINIFLKPHDSYISSRLDNIKLRLLSKEEIERTEKLIAETEQNTKKLRDDLNKIKIINIDNIFVSTAKTVFTNDDILTDIEMFNVEDEIEDENI